jgi:hypothetical protein
MTVMRPSYADVARRLVRRLRGEAPPRLPADRRRLVAAVEQALHARARRRARTRFGFVAAGVAAVAAVALFALGPRLRRDAPASIGVAQRSPEQLAAPVRLAEAPATAESEAVRPGPSSANRPAATPAEAATVTGARVSRRFASARAGERRRAAEPAEAVAAAPATTPVPPANASDLTAQNDLFAAAVRAKKTGELREAARLFGKLMDEHPRGPLVESAAVQRMKALASVDPAAGGRAAREYLARFPGGFARSDAEALASRSAP